MLQYLSAAAWFQILECRMARRYSRRPREVGRGGSAAKVAGMIGLIPFGFHAAGFRAPSSGSSFRETLKYFISSIGAPWRAGGFARDTLVTLVVGVIAATGPHRRRTGIRAWFGKFLHARQLLRAAVGLP